jgi:hypothetical protein
MHANEPSIEELKKIQKELMEAERTDFNIKILKVVEIQIARIKKEEAKNK